MSAVSTILARLRAAIWAIDVRDDIANAIEQCYSDVSNPTLKTEALEAALQNKIDEGEMAALTIGDHTITAAKLAQGVIDNTLATSGAAADAKKTGDEITAIKADLDDLDPGLSQQAKAALLSCFRHVTWTDDNEDYYGILYNVLDSGSDPTRPLTFNVPQAGPRTADGFISLYGTPKVKRGAIVSTDTEIAHTIPYYNESQSAYDSESPYYPIPIPVGAQSYWMDGAIENHYAYSAQIVQWNSTTGRWERKHPGAFIWTDALADSETPLSELTPYRQDISSFNDGTYYMMLGIEKCTGTRWSDTDSVKQTFPNGAYVAVEDSSGVVDASIANLALRFSF